MWYLSVWSLDLLNLLILSNLDISTVNPHYLHYLHYLSIGDWWVLYGVNYGEAPYPGGYDWYPCQHERFIRWPGCWLAETPSRDLIPHSWLAAQGPPRPGPVDQQRDVLRRVAWQLRHGDDRDRGQRDDAEPGRGAPRLHRRPPLPPVRGGQYFSSFTFNIRVRNGSIFICYLV